MTSGNRALESVTFRKLLMVRKHIWALDANKDSYRAISGPPISLWALDCYSQFCSSHGSMNILLNPGDIVSIHFKGLALWRLSNFFFLNFYCQFSGQFLEVMSLAADCQFIAKVEQQYFRKMFLLFILTTCECWRVSCFPQCGCRVPLYFLWFFTSIWCQHKSLSPKIG